MPIDAPPADPSGPGGVPAEVDAERFAYADDRQLTDGHVGVRTGVLSRRALSYGIGVPDSAEYVRRAVVRGLPRVHRSSGGTGLLHERRDVVWTLVVPRRHPALDGGFTRAYPRLGQGVVEGLRAVGVEAAWVPAPGLAADYCTLSERGSVLAAGPWVIGGAAQHLTGTHLLHHGVISWAVDRATIGELFDVPGGPAVERLGGLADLSVAAPPGSVARVVRAALAHDLRVPEID
ncbi:MAG TPA: hypothetical protein VMG36_01550 [Thermoplasmata archaeon]|nr:hypothetical protein [Thermoplasmata archaeon]